MIGFLHGYEWLIILVVALLLFGHRIPGMARSLGSGITEFKKGLKGDDDKRLPDDRTRNEAPRADTTSVPSDKSTRSEKQVGS
jgi:sec-independent protein translocase protein TatA